MEPDGRFIVIAREEAGIAAVEVSVLNQVSTRTAGFFLETASGEVIKGNDALVEDPALVNSDPEGEGWFFKMTLTDSTELDALMDEDAYKEFIADL